MSPPVFAPISVNFDLEQDEYGYPPYVTEDIDVAPLSDGVGAIISPPFFVRGLSVGDIISYNSSVNGFKFSELLSARGGSTIRVIPSGRVDARDFISRVEGFGGAVRFHHETSLVAIEIPLEADYPSLAEFIDAGFKEGRWDSEEACISTEHNSRMTQ